MDRGHRAISGWLAILLAPIAVPIALIAGILKTFGFEKPCDLSADEVAGYIRDFIEGTGGDWDWDVFENMRLRDPALEAIRNEACWAGPPDPDLPKLMELLVQVEGLRAASAA